MKDPGGLIAEFITGLRFEDIPAKTARTASLDIMDYFGNALGGSSDPAVERLLELLPAGGPCTAIASGHKMTPENAAMVNGVMGFALDFDDTHERANIHLSVGAVPAACAAAELVGSLSGRELITAVLAGIELATRLGISCKRKIPEHVMGGWNYSSLHGVFSGTAAAGRILGLSSNEMLNALGLAYHQASGTTLPAMEMTDGKKLSTGFSARNAVVAALMARAGLTGPKTMFSDGQYGLFSMYHDGGDPDKLANSLGSIWEVDDLSFKPYACCRLSQRHLDAVLELKADNAINAADVESIELVACARVYNQLCVPREPKIAPEVRTAAQFSLPWLVACAVTDGFIGVGHCLPQSLVRPELRALAPRVTAVIDPSLRDEHDPGTVTIVMKDGRKYSKKYGRARGGPENPLTDDELYAKFLDTAGYCRKKFMPGILERAFDLLRELEKTENVCEIMSLLA